MEKIRKDAIEHIEFTFGAFRYVIEHCNNSELYTMIYKFDDYWEAMIDAINNGEDIDKVVHLVFREKVDWPIVKEKLLKEINNKCRQERINIIL